MSQQRNLLRFLPYIVLGTVILLTVFAMYFGHLHADTQKQLKKANTNPSSSQKVAKQEMKSLTDEVSKLIELPSEQPTVATITDITKLKDQSFFQDAKNGDKVLIFPNAKKAILYDPIQKKVIDVAPISIGSESAQQVPPDISGKSGGMSP